VLALTFSVTKNLSEICLIVEVMLISKEIKRLGKTSKFFTLLVIAHLPHTRFNSDTVCYTVLHIYERLFNSVTCSVRNWTVLNSCRYE
jgi:hypothetical protein